MGTIATMATGRPVPSSIPCHLGSALICDTGMMSSLRVLVDVDRDRSPLL